MALGLTACFTGVESTPKITANDVKRQHLTVTPEQALLQDVAPEPLGQWHPGKKFWVTDAKLDLVLASEPGAQTPQPGMFITYQGQQRAATLTGEEANDLRLQMPDGSMRRYRVAKAQADEPLTIPFTVEMSLLDTTAQLLDGHRDLYTLTSSWYDTQGRPRNGLHYVKVHLLGITPGTHVYPVAVTFEHQGDTAMMYMNVGGVGGAVRTFDTLFAFDDPHKHYPDITDGRWHDIVKGYITEGMTRIEVRLAIGRPPRLDRYPGTDGVVEVWQYDDGTYLVFDGQGLLTRLMRR